MEYVAFEDYYLGRPEMDRLIIRVIPSNKMCIRDSDQHLVTSINDLSCEEWDATYGEVYKACIDAGVLSCMVGQIMQPAYSKKLNPELKDEEDVYKRQPKR